MVFRCSVKNCTKTIADKVTLFNAKKIANYEQISNDLIESKRQKICSDHFEFKYLSIRLKTGAFATIFERENSTNTKGNPSERVEDHRYCLPNDFLTRKSTDKKEKTKHLKLVNQRKRRAEAKVSLLTQKLGNKATTGCYKIYIA